MADPKKNPLLGAFRTPEPQEPPTDKAEAVKKPTQGTKEAGAVTAGVEKPADGKKETEQHGSIKQAVPAPVVSEKKAESKKEAVKDETPKDSTSSPAASDKPVGGKLEVLKGKTTKNPDDTPAVPDKPEEGETERTDEEPQSSEKEVVELGELEELPSDFKLNIVPGHKLGTVTMIPIDLIDDFEGHPFPVRDDKDMEELTASIKQVGLLEPTTVIRNQKKFGRFEMVAGHRRKHAALLAGLTHIPAIVRDMDQDEATIYMVDSNLKREKISPMEKARAYTMKSEALRRKAGRRSKEETKALEAAGIKPLTADQELARQTGESVATVQRIKTLTKLTEPLQEMVDNGKLPVNTAVDIAQMKPEEQDTLADAIQREDNVPSGSKAKELKEASKAGTLTTEKIEQAVAPTRRELDPPLKITLGEEDLRPYFPGKGITIPDVKRGIFEALDLRKKALERQKAKAQAEKEEKKSPPAKAR